MAKQSNAARNRGPEVVGPTAKAARVPEFDRLIHERTRLAIISALAANEAMTFSDLKRLLGMTDGNLSIHARKLEDAGYVACTKSFEGRTPKTEYRITETGRAAFRQWLDHMEALLKAMKENRQGGGAEYP